MKQLNTFVPLEEITSTFLNSAQDATLTARAALPTSGNDLVAMTRSPDGVVFSYPTGVAAGHMVEIDCSLDWHDRLIRGIYQDATGATKVPGGAADNAFNAAALQSMFFGYTGHGGYGDAMGAQVSIGNPPVSSAGASWFVHGDGATNQVYLYVDFLAATPKGLWLYNNTGGTIYPVVWVECTGRTGKRS